jgi:hypothetical protein
MSRDTPRRAAPTPTPGPPRWQPVTPYTLSPWERAQVAQVARADWHEPVRYDGPIRWRRRRNRQVWREDQA